MAKYGAKAQASVAREIKAMKEGKLRSGSGAKVTNPKQAVAIGLSEARSEGAKLPPAPAGTASARKTGSAGAKQTAGKKAAAKKAPARKATAKKTAMKKTATKKLAAKRSS